MTSDLSNNTKAILLLTAPLIAGRNPVSSNPLSPGDYNRLASRLHQLNREPADLLEGDADELLNTIQDVVDGHRVRELLARGGLLATVVSEWQQRGIWVISRADENYPRRLRGHLGNKAPAVLYGTGDISLLDTGGLAVVGSRQVDEDLIEYTMEVGRLAARAGKTIVSGAARGIDQAAMRGAVEKGGRVSGVLANNLERVAINREHRDLLFNDQLVLISPYDPKAGFHVGHAMQRNKLIYALADAALVVNSDLNKGGTWAGAVEQLGNRQFVPVYVRSTGTSSPALNALLGKGALPWPNPQDAEALEEVFNAELLSRSLSAQMDLGLRLNENPSPYDAQPTDTQPTESVTPDATVASQDEGEAPASESPISEPPETVEQADHAEGHDQSESSPAETLFETVRTVIQQLLNTPMSDAEVASSLDVSKAQAKNWLERLVKEGVLEKHQRPVRFVVKAPRLLD